MNKAVHLTVQGSIGIVEMADRESKNTFSDPIKYGLLETFEEIGKNHDIKVVVIHGYDPYFSCGGTQDELIGIFEGRLTFTNLNFYDILLRCEVPVVAAMNGHAVGGGLVLGSYADVIVMGEESVYCTNFMKYGFTPGMGATFIIPHKFGTALGSEMLMTAENYYGRVLKERGAPFHIVKKAQVMDVAMRQAKILADKPRLSLKILKDQLTQGIKAVLPQYIDQELAMHEQSFTQPEVRARIDKLFGR